MDFTYFSQILISGVAVGSCYALAALGFVLIYKSSRVINFALGQMIAIGCFITFLLNIWIGIPLLISAVLACVISYGYCLLIERLFLRKLIGQPVIALIMVTIGLASFLDGLIYLTPFGSSNFSFDQDLSFLQINVGDVIVPGVQTAGMIISFSLIGIFTWFFKNSKMGIAMRAVADDNFAALSVGVSVPAVFGMAWGLAGLSATSAGVVIGMITGLNFPILSATGLTVLPAVILGGLDSIVGAVVGGITIGLVQQFCSGYLDGNFGLAGTSQVMPYVVLLIALMYRPHGLFGTHEIERV